MTSHVANRVIMSQMADIDPTLPSDGHRLPANTLFDMQIAHYVDVFNNTVIATKCV